MSTRTIKFHNNNISESKNIIYLPPKSSARKAEWITAIAGFLNGNASNKDIYNILNGTSTPLASAASAKKNICPTRAKKTFSSKANKKSPVRKSSAMAKTKISKKSPVKSKSTSSASSSAAMAADAAMARSLQNRYMQDDRHFMTERTSIMGGNCNQPWGGPLTNSYLENYHDNTATASYGRDSGRDPSAAAGLKIPANSNDSTKPKHVPVKVKSEPLSHTSTSYATHTNGNASAAASTEEAPLQPNSVRESNMVANLREMGFTDTHEILTALRAVASDREEIIIVSAPFGMGTAWSAQEQVDAAMMWIVTQREEAAEAQKLDDARISSELDDAATEQSRKQGMERDLNNADLVDLLGSVNEDDSIEIRSSYFPSSVLLRNRLVNTVFRAIASGTRLGKEQVVRLLSLEKKGRKWYGTVLPFSYFKYVLCPRLGSWADELQKNKTPSTTLCQKLSCESDDLERAMYNLSEQEEGGVGSVPKVFLAAQRDASEKGEPTSAADKKSCNDDEVLLLPPRVGRSQSCTASASGNISIEVVDLI
mmetsp:Transcript_6230/g.11941  ORF Transcript_6230/g.11941 Transcript_6230/m.11941 type:complete len:539 (-) Transcript_6230:225-1841(-)